VYLTTLYSIADGCNVEIYGLIRNAIMQEMLHFSLVGNMLISLGEVPEIDSPNFAPSYPGHLPGCVLPGLNVTLKKFTKPHIHNVFMGIEVPQQTLVGGPLNYSNLFTIGALYDEVKECILELEEAGTEIFDHTTVRNQVKWEPWGSTSIVGDLITISNTADAVDAINTIVSQGEGSSVLNPKDIDDSTLAHFFRFEEIFCGRHIRKINATTYSYSGLPITYNRNGVAQMRANPTSATVPPDSVCYSQSRVFHNTYRAFLRKLQEVFNGNPDDLFVAIELMEALQLNAKRLMWIKINPDDPLDHTTCGPVWNYDWN
jgi:hypothetical protein